MKTSSNLENAREHIDPIERSNRNPTSLRYAINAKCFECQGFGADPAPSWRIGNCEIPRCPLYKVRPFQEHYGKPIPKALL